MSEREPIFGDLGLLPERFHFVQRRLFQRAAGAFQGPLDIVEARAEFFVGPAERCSGIELEVTAEIVTANSMSPNSSLIEAVSPLASASRNSPISSSILSRIGAASLQSKPTRPALSCSFRARVNAGRATGTLSRKPLPLSSGSSPRARRALHLSAFSSPLIFSHMPSLPASGLFVAEDVRMAADHLLW